MKLVFASANENKVAEIRSMLPENFTVSSLKDLNITEEIPETSATIEGNAMQKTNYLVSKYNIDCFSDDTGLEIEALNGEPGVLSARFAGSEKSAEKNMALVLEMLSNQTNRKAQFKTVIALSIHEKIHLFEGIVKGEIRNEKSGSEGFGYDPIFEPENCGKTFAEMTLEEKNKMSHRKRAFQKMIDFLNKMNEVD
jgi:XTP/dITP diphosphohydrolase